MPSGCTLQSLEYIFLLRDEASAQLQIGLDFTKSSTSTLRNWLTRILPVLLKVIKTGYILILSIDEFGSTRAAQCIELKTQRPLSVARIAMLDALQVFDRRMWNAYTETLDKWMEKPKIEIGREVCATDRLTITRSSEMMRCLEFLNSGPMRSLAVFSIAHVVIVHIKSSQPLQRPSLTSQDIWNEFMSLHKNNR
jgi:hypothetical protein